METLGMDVGNVESKAVGMGKRVVRSMKEGFETVAEQVANSTEKVETGSKKLAQEATHLAALTNEKYLKPSLAQISREVRKHPYLAIATGIGLGYFIARQVRSMQRQ